MTEFSWKKYQFITEVQTALLAQATNIAVHDHEVEHQADYSGSCLMIQMHQAFNAAERLPDDLSAHEAASDFYGACIGENEFPHWAQDQ